MEVKIIESSNEEDFRKLFNTTHIKLMNSGYTVSDTKRWVDGTKDKKVYYAIFFYKEDN